MGELFRQILPATPFPWTGERMVTGQTGPIEAEHYHRYFLARELSRAKDVLDVASGEGYGSAFLAQTARSVVGIDIDPASVEHAAREYRSANLRYTEGEATKLPLDDHSVDVVVSFETIEHLADQCAFLAEVKRLLRPGGFLIVSTPDMNVYSGPGTEANPYHVRELTEPEFRETLARAFRHVSLLRQRAITGSAMFPEPVKADAENTWVFEQRDSQSFESDHKLHRAPYLMAVASDYDVPSLGVSLFIQSVNVPAITAEVNAELERLRAVEQNIREQGPALQAELDRLRAVERNSRDQELALAKAMADAATLPAVNAELAPLRLVEATAREDAAAVARLAGDAASARAEAAGHRLTANTLETELQRLRHDSTAIREALESDLARTRNDLAEQRDRARAELSTAREEISSQSDRLEHAREELSASRSQLDAAMSLARQQSLTSQRSVLELLSVRQELEHCKQEVEQHKTELLSARKELDDYKWAYEQAASLLIPLRLRRALPESLKTPLRAMKRVIRSLTRRTQ